MDNKQVNKAPQKSAHLVLQAVTAIARSNANSLCRGLLYEPKVPTQLCKGQRCYQSNQLLKQY